MTKVWHTHGLLLAVVLATVFAIAVGGCNREAGREGGFEYAIKGFSAELTGVGRDGGENEGASESGLARERLEVPPRLGGKRVRQVAAGAFRGTDATSVKIPWRVSQIGAGAFAGCTNLLWVELPSRLERLEEELFRDCTRMEESEIPERVKAIGARAYSGCIRLRRVSFPENLRSVGEYAFSGCAMLESVELPEGISDIPDGAFEGCRRLKSVRIPAGVTNIGAKAFAGCISLVRIELPEGVRSVGDEAFAQCGGVESVALPRSLEYLGKGTFAACGRLQAVEVADGHPVFALHDGVLFRDGGKELTLFPAGRGGAYAVPDGVERIGPGAFRGARVETVKVPGGVGMVAQDSFRDCRALRQVMLGEGVRELGGGAFAGCSSLWVFKMPDSVEKAGKGLFAGCAGLRLLVYPDALGRTSPPQAAWQVPDGCTTCSRSAWKEERNGKWPGRSVAPFYGRYADEDLDTVVFEGTVLAASTLPDPAKNDYDDCLYAILVELDSVLSTTPASTNAERVMLVNVPVMEDRTIVREYVFEPGDTISCTCASYDDMPLGILEIQLSDDIRSFEHRQYYPLQIERIQAFRQTGNKDFAKREISILPIRTLPRDAAAAAARRERIRSEIARIEGELAQHGGSFEAWKEEYTPVAERYARLCEEKQKHAGWIGDSYFAAGGPETTYDTQAYIEGLLPYKKYLEEHNIDLIVARVPSRWDFAARVLGADDFRENPAWVENQYECLKHDIEIIDPMPEMWKERFAFPLFYFYHWPAEYHPCEGTAFVLGKEIADVLKRYPYPAADPGIVLRDFVCEIDRPEYHWPGGNGKFDPAENLVMKQAVQDDEPVGVVLDSGSPFLFFSGSSFWFPQGALGASVPAYAAYFLQTRPDWFYQRGDVNPLIKHLANSAILHSRRVVIFVGGPETWQGFPPMPRYIQDGARRISHEKTIPADSDEIKIDGKGAYAHSATGDGAVVFVPCDNPCAETMPYFDLAFTVPYMEGKRACMVRVNLGKASHLFVHLLDGESDEPVDTSSFLPAQRQVADFFVPLSKPETGVKIRFQPKNDYGLTVRDIELWYY